MGERKVLNKYYPPDFDPAKLPRTYLGIQIFRFYFKCTRCSAELTMKTDPQNSDYVVESGAARNFEPWRAEDKETDEMKKKREAEEMGDAMKSLENRTLDSKREMDILAALDEMKSMKSRHATVSVDEMLAALQRTAADKEKRLEEEDEALIKSIFSNNSEVSVSRIRDEDIETEEDLLQLSNGHGETSNHNAKRQKLSKDHPGKATDTLTKVSLDDSDKQEKSSSNRPKLNPLVKISVIKKPGTSNVKSPAEAKQKEKEEDNTTNSTTGGLLSLCQNYGSDDD
ncbi:hypothetical protein TSUD_149510 [Trifolium subterraneum]|uniref:Splicing factor YJU2 n=1 Tax=Trifolium subterraneum TaxID=3900 RepID=A0A2Z6N8D3_TRISU|nr:hypothetical protein TSUD_149510 [Trifolium subterraneum]